MAKAGADVLIPHMGLTTKGSIGAKTALTLEEAAKRVQAMHDAAKQVNPDILVLCHGGPISEPEDVRYILKTHDGHRRGLPVDLVGPVAAPSSNASYAVATRSGCATQVPSAPQASRSLSARTFASAARYRRRRA